MDEASAHLDRGWDHLNRGSYALARVSATKAVELSPNEPEGYYLLGVIAAADGTAEEALEHFEEAMGLDDGYVDPILSAAELHLSSLDDPERCRELCDDVLSFAEETHDVADALLLKAEALLALDDAEAARTCLDDLPPGDLDDADLCYRLGAALLDLRGAAEAEKPLRRAIELKPSHADAHYSLGLCLEEQGRFEEARRFFRTVLDLDASEPGLPWSLPRTKFEEIAERVLGDLPEAIRERLANVAVVVADRPAVELVVEGMDPRMLGYFAGLPYPEQAAVGSAAGHLDCIFLYRSNIERVCRSADEIAEEIRVTLIHETGHFFGLSENELEELGLG